MLQPSPCERMFVRELKHHLPAIRVRSLQRLYVGCECYRFSIKADASHSKLKLYTISGTHSQIQIFQGHTVAFAKITSICRMVNQRK